MHLVSIVICSIAGYSPAAYDFLDEKRRLFYLDRHVSVVIPSSSLLLLFPLLFPGYQS